VRAGAARDVGARGRGRASALRSISAELAAILTAPLPAFELTGVAGAAAVSPLAIGVEGTPARAQIDRLGSWPLPRAAAHAAAAGPRRGGEANAATEVGERRARATAYVAARLWAETSGGGAAARAPSSPPPSGLAGCSRATGGAAGLAGSPARLGGLGGLGSPLWRLGFHGLGSQLC
jgi:hypothetical protein